MPHPDSKKEVRACFNEAIAISFFSLLFLGLLLDGGMFSEPAPYFYLPFIAYLLFRPLPWHLSGAFPKLSRLVRYAISFSPLYGFPLFWILSSLIRDWR